MLSSSSLLRAGYFNNPDPCVLDTNFGIDWGRRRRKRTNDGRRRKEEMFLLSFPQPHQPRALLPLASTRVSRNENEREREDRREEEEEEENKKFSLLFSFPHLPISRPQTSKGYSERREKRKREKKEAPFSSFFLLHHDGFLQSALRSDSSETTRELDPIAGSGPLCKGQNHAKGSENSPAAGSAGCVQQCSFEKRFQ